MARSLAQMMKEADSIIEKCAAVQKTSEVTPVASFEDDDLFKLAEAVRNPEVIKTASVTTGEEFFFDDNEKLANSMAILETVFSKDALTKFAQFEKLAKERGVSQEAINEVFEKIAGAAEVGSNISKFMHGAGNSIANIFESLPGKLHAEKAVAAGQVAGAIAPFAAAAGLGAYAGSALKERSIKNQFGIQ